MRALTKIFFTLPATDHTPSLWKQLTSWDTATREEDICQKLADELSALKLNGYPFYSTEIRDLRITPEEATFYVDVLFGDYGLSPKKEGTNDKGVQGEDQ